MATLHKALRAEGQKLKIALEQTRSIPHHGLLGESREDAVRDLLDSYLPKRVSVRTGIIENKRGEQSRQQDCVLLDSQNFFPLLKVHDVSMFPIESVLATVEIKSNTKKATLEEAIRNVESVKGLASNGREWSPFGGILCMAGQTKLNTLAATFHAESMRREARLRCDVLLVVDGGVLFWGDEVDGSPRLRSPRDSETLIAIESPDDTLWIFMLAIHRHLQQAVAPTPDFFSYLDEDSDLTYRTVTR